MANHIKETLYAQTASDGSTIYTVAVIDCDTVSDLPGINDFSGLTLMIGSRAHDIDQNAWYEMQSSGTWVLQEAGAAGYTKSEIDTMMAAKQDLLTFDTVPTVSSTNPVTSGGILNWVYGSAPTQISTGDDLNNYYNIGTYRAASNAIAQTLSNCPTTYGFRLEVVSTIASVATGYQIQRLYPNNSLGEFYMRRRLSAGSGNWGPWFLFSGTEVSPFPADCPFTCNILYFVDSAVTVEIGGRTFTKSTSEYAIGAIVHFIYNGNTYTVPFFTSPVSATAVAFSYNPSPLGTVTYDGVTWYYSDGANGMGGELTGTGLPVYGTTMSAGYPPSEVLQFLSDVNAANVP